MSRGDKTVVYQDSRGEWRWRRVASNGEIIAVGEGHSRRSDAERSASRAFLGPDTPDHPDDQEDGGEGEGG
jgi:uncharacterized protein YegP (UPF0339 family)